MSRIDKFLIAPGGTAELAAAGVAIRDRASGERVAEATPDDFDDALLVGMRAEAPGRQVPGTVSGYPCARCGVDVRLAPSGQGMAAKAVPVWCVQCFAARQGAS